MSSEEEIEGYVEPVPVPAPARRHETIKLITKESLLPEQREVLHKVMEILNLKEQHARILLIHYRWNLRRLFHAFLAAEEETDRFYSQAGVAITLKSTNSVVTICNFCLHKDLREDETTTMDCGHNFCNDCWTKHFLVKINEGQSKRIKCMDPECNVICDEDIVRKLVNAKDPKAAERFDRFLFESFIDDNDQVKRCPSDPNCGNAVLVERDVYCEIQCVCGHQFCFNCLAEPHSPCSCLISKLWNEKCEDVHETLYGTTVSTKPCPKCRTIVEKKGILDNSMTCSCGHRFCWSCGGATTFLNHDLCRSAEEKEEEIEKAHRDLKRYTDCYSKWKAHKNSLKLEANQRELFMKNILDSDIWDYSWPDALQRLFRSRRALCYFYPFSFYMFGDDILRENLTATEKESKQCVFEFQRQHLEETVEQVSRMIERPFGKERVMHIKKLCFIADKLCRNMYDAIQTDLVLNLGLLTYQIAPYNSMG